MKLFAQIRNIDLLKKSMQGGTAFYRYYGDNVIEVVYFSGSRLVHFKGKIQPEQLQSIHAQAFPAEDIEINETQMLLKIRQKEGPLKEEETTHGKT